MIIAFILNHTNDLHCKFAQTYVQPHMTSNGIVMVCNHSKLTLDQGMQHNNDIFIKGYVPKWNRDSGNFKAFQQRMKQDHNIRVYEVTKLGNITK